MPLWFWISFGVICLISLGALLIFYREIQHVCKSQIQILGAENSGYVFTRRFKIFQVIYISIIILLMLIAGLFYWMYL